MIRTHVDGINPDVYCYDTGLTFGLTIADEILKQVNNEYNFERRSNYNETRDIKTLIKSIGAEKTRELARRKQQTDKLWPGQQQIKFKQYSLTDDLCIRLLEETPEWLKLFHKEPWPILQISDSGDFLPVHKGEERRCGLFMLLESDEQETRWYRDTEPFEIIEPLKIPDMDKIEQVVSVIMEPGRWYMFNNDEWHSVHKFSPGSRRVSVGLDFFSIGPEELLKLLKDNE